MFQTWSWLETLPHRGYEVFTFGGGRLLHPQRAALLKWSRRGVKKKVARLQPSQTLNHHLFRKPIGVRMGSGRGKPSVRFTYLARGQGVVRFLNCNRKPVVNVRHFFKKSNLQLVVLARKL